MYKLFLSFILFSLLLLFSCSQKKQQDDHSKVNVPSGKLIIFNAGSFSVPLKDIATGFNKEYPEIKLETEASGSLSCVRKITDLHRDCDIFISADYNVIDQLLIPEYADWNIQFATNEMVIIFDEESSYTGAINSQNWYEILARDDVKYGRSEPDSDPCGYRAIMTMQLAEKYYNDNNITQTLLSKDIDFIRPKSADLIALMEVHAIDYFFGYKSVAIQHGLEYVSLPDEINLGNPSFADNYKQAMVSVAGKNPGDTISIKGEPILYGLCVIKKSKNYQNAILFLDYLLDKRKGMKILEENGQHGIVPTITGNFKNIPESLKKFVHQSNT